MSWNLRLQIRKYLAVIVSFDGNRLMLTEGEKGHGAEGAGRSMTAAPHFARSSSHSIRMQHGEAVTPPDTDQCRLDDERKRCAKPMGYPAR
jgi:hypothetical protein